MKWLTREHPRVDRVACPWLIEKFVDKAAEFVYVPTDKVMTEAQRTGATPYDVKDVELGHHGPECSFDAFVHKYGLDKDPAMAYMAKVIRGADTDDKTVTTSCCASPDTISHVTVAPATTMSSSGAKKLSPIDTLPERAGVVLGMPVRATAVAELAALPAARGVTTTS